MKISVSGKGGSGKSTVTSLIALELRDRGYRPVIVDSDESNSVLFRMLGMERPPEPLIALAGGRQNVRKLMPPGYRPGESGSTHVLTQTGIRLKDIPAENVAEKDNLRLIVIGKIEVSQEGCACPMGVLGKEFLGKLHLEEDEIVLVDMEAGLEHLGRGVETSLDSVLVVVEPSFESVNLAARIRDLAAASGIRQIWVVLNKIGSPSTAAKLKQELGKRDIGVIGSLPSDEGVFNACLEGRPLSIGTGELRQSLRSVVDTILERAASSA